MLLDKMGLHAVDLSTTDDPRFAIGGVLVQPDGSTVATDGHALVHYQPAGKLDGEDYPAVDGCNAGAPGELEPFVLPAGAAARILRAVPKSRECGGLPVLTDTVALDVPKTNADGCAVLAVTDLENPQIFRPRKLEGSFPRWENVVPAPDRDAPAVGLSVRLILRTFCMLQRMGCEYVKVQLAPDKPADKPVRIEGKTERAAVTAVVMPCHL